MPDDELLTTAQVARHFRVDASSVRRWVDNGQLRPTLTTPGGHYRFARRDVETLAAKVGHQ